MTSLELASYCAAAASDKKAEDIIALDLRGISTFTEFFLICSGTSEPHLKAIASGIEESVFTGFKRHPVAVDGYPLSQWVVMDYGDIVIHIFHQSKREFYSLEDLWSDAPRIDFVDQPPVK